jgi:hypothetical protein
MSPTQLAVDAEVVDQHIRTLVESYHGPEPEDAKARLVRIRRHVDKLPPERRAKWSKRVQEEWETYWAAVEHYATLERLCKESKRLWAAAGGRREWAGVV